jgi:hypothetical protein
MNMEQAIRAVIGHDASEDRVLAVARRLIDQGEREPMPAAIAAADDAIEDRGVCRWFANCDRIATHDEPHPILGSVPTCDPCGEWIAEQSAAERN